VNDTTSFRAMGCSVVVAGATRSQLDAIVALFQERERTFSRFLPDGELATVNASPQRAVMVSEVFARAVSTALAAAEQTGGLVDPTLLGALEAAGYGADIRSLAADPRPPGDPVQGRWRSIRLAGRALLRPSGIALDLNGVVKSMTVDEAVALLSGPGFVSAGGDLRARGELDVALPDGTAVRLRRGALATSGTTTRHWERGGARQHHLIDPRTGRPSTSTWEQVTACAATCVGADVAAKAAFLLGEDGPSWLDERRIPGRFLAPDGSAVSNASWAAATEPVCT
jgi:thiamine biosynthesis lipoprotein